MKADIGTISHGTMRPEDLIPAFASELENLDDLNEYKDLIKEANEFSDWDSEDAIWLLDSLFDALDDYAPADCYFGANEGDGADYGFWPVEGEYRCDAE